MSREVEIREEPMARITEHARISIAFRVERVLQVELDASAPGGARLREIPAEPAYLKDYDTIAGNHPTDWLTSFDTSGWGLLSAHLDARRVGGIVIAHGADDVDMLEGRSDLAVLWDVRVAPESRGRRVGSALMAAAERWARSRGCRELKVETQHINVGASRLYEAGGFSLAGVDPHAYPDLPGEIQLIWRKDLC